MRRYMEEALMPWPEIIALLWVGVFVACVATLGRDAGDQSGIDGQHKQSMLARAAVLFVAISLVVLIAVPLALGR